MAFIDDKSSDYPGKVDSQLLHGYNSMRTTQDTTSQPYRGGKHKHDNRREEHRLIQRMTVWPTINQRPISEHKHGSKRA